MPTAYTITFFPHGILITGAIPVDHLQSLAHSITQDHPDAVADALIAQRAAAAMAIAYSPAASTAWRAETEPATRPLKGSPHA